MIMLATALSGFAQADNKDENVVNPDDLVIIGDKIAEIEGILRSVEGYVFLEKGPEKARDLSSTFNRTDQVVEEARSQDHLQSMNWSTLNSSIAYVNDEGIITGYEYGQTLLTLENGDKKHYFIVFVCPTVTVVSPDGVVYTHQKVYNEKMKVDFSQSDDYVINSVMATYQERSYDVTDKIDINGHYESSHEDGSDLRITSDVVYTLSLEKEPADHVVSKSPYRWLVANGAIQLASSDPVGKPLTRSKLEDLKVTVSVMRNTDIHGVSMKEDTVYGWMPLSTFFDSNLNDGVIDLDFKFNQGIYNISLKDSKTGEEYSYKIVIRFQ